MQGYKDRSKAEARSDSWKELGALPLQENVVRRKRGKEKTGSPNFTTHQHRHFLTLSNNNILLYMSQITIDQVDHCPPNKLLDFMHIKIKNKKFFDGFTIAFFYILF